MANAPTAASSFSDDALTVFEPAVRLRALIGVVVVAAMAIGFLAAGPQFLNDPDTLWHVAVGKDIWLTKSFPHADAYSHTFAGEPWIAKEWLSQIILYAAFVAGGWNGVALATIAVLLFVTWRLYGAMSAHLKPIVAAAVTVGALSLGSDVFVARPHVLVLPVIMIFVQGVWTAAQDRRAPSFWLLAVMCVWSNMHASFTFGFAAAFLAFLFYLYETRDLRSKTAMQWVALGALLPVAAMVHPYGFESIWSTVTIVENEALPYITEWRAFSLPQDTKVELALLGLLVLALVSGFRVQVVTALFLCLLLHMYMTHTRFTYLLFTLAPLLMVRDVAAQFPTLSYAAWAREAETSPTERMLAANARLAIPIILAVIAAGAAAIGARANWTPPGTSYPIAAIKAAEDYGVAGNVLNEYNFGGALIFEGEKTFVDGRADRLFQQGFIPNIAASMKPDGADILRQQIDDYGIGWSIVKPSDGRAAHFGAMGWRRIYDGEFAVVYAAPAPTQ